MLRAWASVPEDGGQAPQSGVEGTLIFDPPKVFACYVHLCILYCNIML